MQKEIGEGDLLCKGFATDIESHEVILLCSEAYPFLAGDVKSGNSQFLKLIDLVPFGYRFIYDMIIL